MSSVWHFPTRIVFGAGCVSTLAEEVKQIGGRKVFVLADPGVLQVGLVTKVQEALDGGGLEHELFTQVSSNPLEAEVLSAIAAYKASKADVVVALGGGSPLDVGKLVCLGASHPLPLAQYDDALGGDALIKEPIPPMIAIPTTAGTGSEVGRSAVLTIEATQRKTVIFSPRLLPAVAFLDPELTLSMPAHITAATGFDALTHCIEAYASKGEHPMADAIALHGIEMIARHLTVAVKDGTQIEARAAMLQAAMMGAVAFQKGLGACHSLAHPLSAEFGMHHGLANAVCLPAVLRFNNKVIPKKLERIAEIIRSQSEAVEFGTADTDCAEVIAALRNHLGLPASLRQAGLEQKGASDADLSRLAQLAMEDACHTCNPRSCTRNDMLQMFQSSW